jgi:hypothetical protein
MEDEDDPFSLPLTTREALIKGDYERLRPPVGYPTISWVALIPAVRERLNCSEGRAIGIINRAAESGEVQDIHFCFETAEWVYSTPEGENYTFVNVDDFWDWFARQNYRPSNSEIAKPNKRAAAQAVATTLWTNGHPPAAITDKAVCAAVRAKLGAVELSDNTILRAVGRK